MTISLADNSPRDEYTLGAGATQQVFTVSFEFFNDTDLSVYVDGVEKTLGTASTTAQYVTANTTATGSDRVVHVSGTDGFIQFGAELTGASGGSKIVITRDIVLSRTTDFPTSGPFDVSTLNTELDKFIAISADLKDQASRALQLTDFDAAATLTLPALADRKGKVLAFNASTGAVEAGPTITATQTVAAQAADIDTVAGIASNITSIVSNLSAVQGASTAATNAANSATAAATSATAAASSASSLTTGISANNVLQADTGLADDDFLRIKGTKIEGRSAAELRADIGATTIGAAVFTAANVAAAQQAQDLEVGVDVQAFDANTKKAGKETMWIPAVSMYPNTTNGCAATAQTELSNGPEIKTLDFDKDSDEFAQFAIAFPKSWNEGTVSFQAFFTANSTNTGTTAFVLNAVALPDNGDLNTAFGTAVGPTAKAMSGTANDLAVTAESGAVTIAGSPSTDEYVFFQLMRDVSEDSLAADAKLLGIKLFFTTDAANDA